MALEVRAAQLGDAPALGPLLLQLGYDGTDEQVRRRLDRVLRRMDNAVYVAIERPHGVVGLVHAVVQVTLLGRPFAEVGALIVSSEQRGSGIGRALLEKVHTWAIKRGLDEVTIRSQEHRRAAHAFFARLGYRQIKSQRVFSLDLSDPRRTGENTVMD